MKTFLYIIISFSLCSICFSNDDIKYKKEGNVYELNMQNFDEFIKSHDNVLVKFCIPWSKHCQALEPHFVSAADVLIKENIFLVHVDLSLNKALTSRFNIRRYPTLFFFAKGKHMYYPGEHQDKDIINWMRRQTGSIIQKLATANDIDVFKTYNNVVAVYFGSNKDKLRIYTMIAKNNDKIIFGVCNDKDITSLYNVTFDSVILFKTFDEKENHFKGPFTKQNLEEFLEIYSKELLPTFNDKIGISIFAHKHPAIILFRDKSSPYITQMETPMKEISRQVRNQLEVIVSDVDKGPELKLGELLGISSKDLPAIVLVDNRNGLKKYRYEGKITSESIMTFINQWNNNKLRTYFKSAPVPKEQNSNVYKLVGSTFKEKVLLSDNDVIVIFHTYHCATCKRLVSELEDIAQKLKHNKHLLFAEMDYIENEIDGTQIKNFPLIQFWAAGKKYKPIEYSGAQNYEGFKLFLQHYATYPIEFNE